MLMKIFFVLICIIEILTETNSRNIDLSYLNKATNSTSLDVYQNLDNNIEGNFVFFKTISSLNNYFNNLNFSNYLILEITISNETGLTFIREEGRHDLNTVGHTISYLFLKIDPNFQFDLKFFINLIKNKKINEIVCKRFKIVENAIKLFNSDQKFSNTSHLNELGLERIERNHLNNFWASNKLIQFEHSEINLDIILENTLNELIFGEKMNFSYIYTHTIIYFEGNFHKKNFNKINQMIVNNSIIHFSDNDFKIENIPEIQLRIKEKYGFNIKIENSLMK